MAEVNLKIHGQNYGIACDDGQENRVVEVGRYVDMRARDIAAAGAASNENHLLVLTALVLADEIKELRDTVGGHVTDTPGQGNLSQEEEQQIVSAIEQLAGRIDSITSKIVGKH